MTITAKKNRNEIRRSALEQGKGLLKKYKEILVPAIENHNLIMRSITYELREAVLNLHKQISLSNLMVSEELGKIDDHFHINLMRLVPRARMEDDRFFETYFRKGSNLYKIFSNSNDVELYSKKQIVNNLWDLKSILVHDLSLHGPTHYKSIINDHIELCEKISELSMIWVEHTDDLRFLDEIVLIKVLVEEYARALDRAADNMFNTINKLSNDEINNDIALVAKTIMDIQL
jgi:hypothetical protein